MLFSSFAFILGFLPLVLAGYWLLARRETARLWFLFAASLVFYGYWDWRFTPLLIGSIVVNWAAAEWFFACGRREVAIAAIVADLACLGIYKYLGFFASILAEGAGWDPMPTRLALPLGISFFTFHHIIYLVDLMGGRAPRYRFRDYALYIALYPQILAGPLVRYWEIVPQFTEPPDRPGWERRVAQGIALFVMGLMKKLFFADALAATADPIFAQAGAGAVPPAAAWSAALAFPLQIYFDFSGYSDMAIGLALLFGFTLPYNFAVPYRATSLQEFWRRWHMTLTRFLRDYLYIPLGGNRQTLWRHILAIFVTLLLGGLWHGAGWTFIVWGGLHGLGLVTGVLWRRRMPPLPKPLGWALLMIFLLLTWVFFRAPSLAAAGHIFGGMAADMLPAHLTGWRVLLIAALVAVVGPSSQQWAERLEPRGWVALAGAAATVAVLLRLGDAPSYEFIYFHF